ncbi:MAG TPA: hypothetical protein VNW26_03270 [Steroidobacteraceae bacterium]|nr:hypothetical protein [Steroidobacteraceae bacterium]
MGYRMVVCATALIVCSAPGLAAELFYMDHDPYTGEYVGPVGPLVISGEITRGDYERLVSKIADDEKRFLALNKIILASDGGDVREAVKIANFINSTYSEVLVEPRTGRCVSACFLIFAGAAQRNTDGKGLIGINRPYFVDTETSSLSPADAATAENGALLEVRAFLRASEVPAYLVDEMFRHASNDAYWLSVVDEAALGHRSSSLNRFLASKCAWRDAIEQEVYARKRPLEDLTRMLKCRMRATEAAARRALKDAERQPHAIIGDPAVSAPPTSLSE